MGRSRRLAEFVLLAAATVIAFAVPASARAVTPPAANTPAQPTGSPANTTAVPGTSKGAATAPQGGAQSPTPAAPPPPPPDGPAQLVTQQWARFWNTQAIEALVGLYAKDGEFYPTSGERVTGQAALRSLFQGALAANRPVITMTSVSGGHSGNVAYDAGDYVEIITRKSSGLAFPVTGRYLIVCRQAPNGHWVISQQMWTEEPKGK